MKGVFSELFWIVPTYYCLRVTSITKIVILIQLFTYCIQKQNENVTGICELSYLRIKYYSLGQNYEKDMELTSNYTIY